MKEYGFDAKLWAAIRITAENEAEARKLLRERLDCANAVIGPNTAHPIICEVSLEDGDDATEIFEVDGEPQ